MTSLPSEAPSSQPVVRQTGEPRWLVPLLLLIIAVPFLPSRRGRWRRNCGLSALPSPPISHLICWWWGTTRCP